MVRTLAHCLSLFLAIAAVGCAATPAAWLRTWGLDPEPRPGDLAVCTSFACAGTARVSLGPEGWGRVRALFDPPPADAPAERLAAARAVGLVEEMVGIRAGTSGDRNQNDVGGDDAGQLDCIAEAANTTTYLLLLERDGLLPRHRVSVPASRGFLLLLPHSTAVLQELEGGVEFAVDSWFGANGEAARVWPLAAWKSWGMDRNEAGVLLAGQGESGQIEGSLLRAREGAPNGEP